MIEDVKNFLEKEPGSKAKDIAKKLKCTTTEVNQILHYNTDLFVQDKENFTWTLVSEVITITFAGQWVDCSLFESALSNVDADFNKCQKINFILPDKCKFFLETIARFLALCNQLLDAEKEVTIDLTNNKSSKSYWNRVGFFDHLNKNAEVLPNWPKISTAKSRKGNNEKLVEFGAVDPKEDCTDLINQLTDAFVASSNKDYENSIFTIFAEMIKNIKDHSESKLKGFAALQPYEGFSKKKPHIQVIVSDSGVGIVATLKPHLKTHYPKLQKLSDLELVKLVLQGKQLSKHGSGPDSGHGLGFKGSCDIASTFKAKYSIRQSDFSLEFEFKNGKLQPPKEQTNLVTIQGTHICFDFVIDDSARTD